MKTPMKNTLHSQSCSLSIVKNVLKTCVEFRVRSTAIFGCNNNKGGYGDKLQWLQLNDRWIA